MSKKLISIIAAVMITAFIASGCSNAGDTNTTETSSAAQTTVATTAENSTAEPTTVQPTTEKQTEAATAKPTEKPTKPTKATKPSPEDSKNNIKVMLDPGHDTTVDSRNHPNLGVNEQDLNFKIVRAAYRRLKKYSGITVYLTRRNGNCPNDKYHYPKTDRYGDGCIHARTDIAEKKKVDLYVSFHCNATTGNLGASANGAEVYVTKYPKFHSKCAKLGNLILNNITSSVDLKSGGVRTRSKPEKGTYKDGTVKDYYYLISNNIDNNRPSIIIEHAYMDNTHDNAILKNDNNLKKLGIADADAIAEYYGLKLK